MAACCSCPRPTGERPAGVGDILIDSAFDLPYPSPVTAIRYIPSFQRGAAETARTSFVPQIAAPMLPLLALVAVVGYLWYRQQRRA